MATDQWLQDLEAAQQTASDTQQLIQARRRRLFAACRRACRTRAVALPCSQCMSRLLALPPIPVQERNLKFPEGGPEASRLTATARRKLGTLGGLLDSLRAAIEAPGQEGL